MRFFFRWISFLDIHIDGLAKPRVFIFFVLLHRRLMTWRFDFFAWIMYKENREFPHSHSRDCVRFDFDMDWKVELHYTYNSRLGSNVFFFRSFDSHVYHKMHQLVAAKWSLIHESPFGLDQCASMKCTSSIFLWLCTQSKLQFSRSFCFRDFLGSSHHLMHDECQVVYQRVSFSQR